MIKKVGFIGLGTMGKLMALNIAQAGYDLIVYDIRDERLREFNEAGAKIARSVKEVAECSDQVTVEILNLHIDRAQAEAYGIDRVPAIVVEGARDYGIRFFGIPMGYEFTNLIDAIVVASSGTPSLGAETLERLAGLKERVHIQVFSTPT